MARTSKATQTKTGGRSTGMDGRLIPLEDDCMFSAVMRNKDACIGLIEALFGGRSIRDVEYLDDLDAPQVQRFLGPVPGGKGVRLDVYFEDSDTVYDIELQRVRDVDLPRRARMYSSFMDADMMSRGWRYAKAKDSYVVFVCKFDPLGKGLKRYSFSMACEEVQGLPLGDGRNIIFLNTKGKEGELGPDIEALFSYINGGEGSIGMETGSPYVDRLDGYVQELNRDKKWRREHMKYELSLEERYDEGERVGFSKGEAAGMSKGEAKEKRRMVKSFKEQGVPLEVIAKASSLSIEEVQRIN